MRPLQVTEQEGATGSGFSYSLSIEFSTNSNQGKGEKHPPLLRHREHTVCSFGHWYSSAALLLLRQRKIHPLATSSPVFFWLSQCSIQNLLCVKAKMHALLCVSSSFSRSSPANFFPTTLPARP
jgi:hypothetical protein